MKIDENQTAMSIESKCIKQSKFMRKHTSEFRNNAHFQLYNKNVSLLTFFYSVFKAITDINNGSILSILPPNVVIIAISMYRMEHVS